MSNTQWQQDQNEAARVDLEQRRQKESAAREDSIMRILAESVASVIEQDPHQWSSRPCHTCRVVSGLLARSFGCEKKGGR
jgi:hypothetical protein